MFQNQEHLKPQIAGGFANAELYCMALGNIYSDPNYHNLNHWAILQTLSRKGVYSNDQSDAQLTETTLIQTHPLRTVSTAFIQKLILNGFHCIVLVIPLFSVCNYYLTQQFNNADSF